MDTKKLKCAVIGSGYLGKFHAEKYAALPDCDLVAVVDIDELKVNQLADRLETSALVDYKTLLGHVDAVSIVVPTDLHFTVARDFLNNASHVLVEKPITTTVKQAEELIKIAKDNDRVLQVGHLERFNAALLSLDLANERPLFIESHRLAPYNPRGNDVNVVLDLMIHDIDIVLHLIGSEVERIDASGTAVLTDDIDIANARIARSSDNSAASRTSGTF